ncbi:hypothetical protein MSAN_01595900 [Mycena sanguinolenta]|uniref:Uncharacterized protein n=1 Tax=Mycena sanguinolenta TaxID=230812 RepID=A0A8H6Y092_9AGAR|nr:hypothetical protein MSAN_01595900 [Mycena sanguinolenta]
MTNPFNWTFEKSTPAFALFFNNDHNQRALRLECNSLFLEFTDGAYIGRDPEGTLYYNRESDFQRDSNRQHIYRVREDVKDGKTYAVIEFRHSANAVPYAKFYAPDNYKVATAAEMGDFTGNGHWVTLRCGHSYTVIEKKSYSSTVTVTLYSDNKSASWNAGSTYFNPSSFRVTGELHYKHIDNLRNAIYANYNNDRIVFYENDWTGRDFVAFFIPKEDDNDSLGIESTRTTPAVTFSNIRWS